MENEWGILLLPKNCEKTHYHGFIEEGGIEYYFELCFEKPFKNIRLQCEWKLKEKLKDNLEKLTIKIQESSSPMALARELRHLLKDSPSCSHFNGGPSIPLMYCSTLIEHIEDLGWMHVNDVSKDFNDISLHATDSAGREHELVVHPTAGFPKECPTCTTDLPVLFRPQWGGIFSNLKNLYQEFVEILSTYQRFWDEIDELHARCWILEPEKLAFGAKNYRIALGSSISILASIDPDHPEHPPECHFMGSETLILPIRESFLNNVSQWNETLSIYQNLKNILQIDFPLKKNGDPNATSIQCGICYSYKLEGDIPGEACNETRCGQLFHRSCLVEWIQSVPGAKQSFQTLFGECPYCNGAITVKLGSRS